MIFKRKYNFVVIILFITLFNGCPLLVENSIDQGSYDIPLWLSGDWTEEVTGDKKPDRYYLDPPDSIMTGRLDAVPYDSNGNFKRDGIVELTFSVIENKIFVQAYVNGDSEDGGSYYIYLFDPISEEEIQLIPLYEDLVDFGISSDALKTWIQENVDNSEIYDYVDAQVFHKSVKE